MLLTGVSLGGVNYGRTMPDPIFADTRLARLYDAFDGSRIDLNAYLAIIHDLGVGTLLDVGCGTGTLALLATAVGVTVTGVDPAAASVEVARSKPRADEVRWHVGTAVDAPTEQVDLATMTGNAAQVFLTDEAWLETLVAIRERLRPGGWFVFETRRPEARAWEQWAEPHEAGQTFPGLGLVVERRTFVRVDLPLVTFGGEYEFPDGSTVPSESTLRFRDDAENRSLLDRAGFVVDELRQAPDRPGLEFVYLCRPR